MRNGVLESMVRQDYEYFDKNSAGILQERLNRDANELGNNMIMFPARNIQVLSLSDYASLLLFIWRFVWGVV